ncbi:hypothetical protein [Bdellovibrio bacteriovorus]|uniref:hypothetical protein n=1 Tax=Bdellovibrio bacteriovorus TaxID=959 RepID=UPI003AA8981F
MNFAKSLLVLTVLAGAVTTQAQIESALEVPVSADKMEMTSSKLNGGSFLRFNTGGGQSFSLKCHQGFGDTKLMVFLKGSMMSTQLSSPVENMETCVQHLSGIQEQVNAGAGKVRIEIRHDHTLGVAAIR